MARRPSARGVGNAALIALLLGVLVTQAIQALATHAPANKVVAAGSKVVMMTPTTNPVTLLSATLKTSKPTDLILTVSMECSITTQLTTGPAATDSAEATGTVVAWVEIDGAIVPINSMSSPPQDPPPAGDGTDKVTFCNRAYHRDISSNDDNEVVNTFIDTKNANSFTWLRLNMGSGPHTIVVKGDLTTATTGDATAKAAVGNRSLIGEPEKLANDVTI